MTVKPVECKDATDLAAENISNATANATAAAAAATAAADAASKLIPGN